MFEEDEFSLFSFLVQQTVVPIIGFVAVLIPNPRHASIFSMPNPTLDNAWAMLIAMVIPFCAALLVRRVAPRRSKDGRLIWAIPMTVLILGIVSESVRSGLRHTVTVFFNPQTGEEGWVLLLVVIPTCACLAYSFGVSRTFSRFSQSRTEPRP